MTIAGVDMIFQKTLNSQRASNEKVYMLRHLKKETWSPYTVGFFIAILAVASFFIFHKTIGTSVTFVKLAALFWAVVNPKHLQENPYYQDYLRTKAWIDWQTMLVLGIFLGAYLSRILSTPSPSYTSPTLWELNWGSSSFKRYIAAFIGGNLVLFGARFAGGCTSGHAITGGFQLALSGWLFMIGVFALGIPTALLMYPKKTKEAP